MKAIKKNYKNIDIDGAWWIVEALKPVNSGTKVEIEKSFRCNFRRMAPSSNDNYVGGS